MTFFFGDVFGSRPGGYDISLLVGLLWVGGRLISLEGVTPRDGALRMGSGETSLDV